MQLVDPTHQGQVSAGARVGLVIRTAPADPYSFGLFGDGELMGTVYHRFTLSNPALVSAPSKKSFSRVSSPILA